MWVPVVAFLSITSFPKTVRHILPGADDTTVERIKSLYNAPAENPEKLAWDWYTDVIFACNAYHTARAYKDMARRYYMSIPPAVHGLDLTCMIVSVLSCSYSPYKSCSSTDRPLGYFYKGNTTTPVASLPLVGQFQEYLRRFITHNENPSNHLRHLLE